jgi:predicted PurR-regulated permease PerM
MAAPDTSQSPEAPATEATSPRNDPLVAPSERTRIPPWVPRVILLVVLAVFASYAALTVFRKLRHLVIWVITALFFSFALEPAVNWLVRKHGWRRGVATAVVLSGLALIVVLMVASMVPLIVNQVQELLRRLPGWLEKVDDYLNNRWHVKANLNSKDMLKKITSANKDLGHIASNVASVGAFIVGLVFRMLTIGLFTFFMVADGPRLRRSVCSLLTPRRQREILGAWEVAIEKTGGYLYSRLLLAGISALLSFIALTLLGVPFAVPLALWMGLVSQFIPVIGTYIAAAVPLLVALMSNPWSALIYLIFVTVYKQIEDYLLSPRITARTMQLHPAVAFFAALAGASIYGVLGAFMALPAAAVIQATVSSYITRHDVVETELTRKQEVDETERERAEPNHRKLWSRLRRDHRPEK